MHQYATATVRPVAVEHRHQELFRQLMATAMLADTVIAILLVPVVVVLVLGMFVGVWLWPMTPILVSLVWLPLHGLSALVLVIRCVRAWNETPTFCVWLTAGILGYVLPPLLGGLALVRIWTGMSGPLLPGLLLGTVLCLQLLSYAANGIALTFVRGVPPGAVVALVAAAPASLIILWAGAYLLLVPP